MDFSIFLSHMRIHPPGHYSTNLYAEKLAEAKLADACGFDCIWLPEHHFSIYGILGDTLTLAAAISQRTKRIKIGTSVVLLPLSSNFKVSLPALTYRLSWKTAAKIS